MRGARHDQQELELLQNLYHANLVQFIDYKDSAEYLYFILEYSPLSSSSFSCAPLGVIL
jgi:hypothetical protein